MTNLPTSLTSQFKLSLAVAVAFILTGCGKSSSEIGNTDLAPSLRIDAINDSTYMGLISAIEYYDNSYYLTDLKNGRVIVLDSSLREETYFGSKGLGPGEFEAPRRVFIKNKTIYALDDGATKINVFSSEGKFLGSLKGILPSSSDFFVTSDSILVGSSLEFGLDKAPLFRYAIGDSSSLRRFGNHERALKNFNNNKPQEFYLKETQGLYLAIGKNDPVIHIYDSLFNKTGTYSYSDYEYLSSFIRNKRERQIREKVGIDNFVADCAVYQDYIYLLLSGFNERAQKGESRHVLKLRIDGSNIKPVETYTLSPETETWYYSFTASKNSIVAFDAISYELHHFNTSER